MVRKISVCAVEVLAMPYRQKFIYGIGFIMGFLGGESYENSGYALRYDFRVVQEKEIGK